MLSQPELALALTGTFVILSQLKINVTNAYAGSIAWSNFFSRLTHSHPGRVVWLVFNVLIALLLMEIGVYKALEQTLALYSNVAIAWVGALVADLVINKPLGLRPPHIEFKRAHLYDINPVGVGAMAIATVVVDLRVLSACSARPRRRWRRSSRCGGVRRRAADRLGHRRQILHRAQAEAAAGRTIDGDQVLHLRAQFEPEDMAFCPAYAGPICSLCCSLDARCHDLCKPQARLQAQIAETARRRCCRKPIVRADQSQLGRYLGVVRCLRRPGRP